MTLAPLNSPFPSSTRPQREPWILRSLALSIALALASFGWTQREPRIEGRPLGDWLADLDPYSSRHRRFSSARFYPPEIDAHAREEARRVVFSLGPSALPHLIRRATKEDNDFSRSMTELLRIGQLASFTGGDFRRQAEHGFIALKSNSLPALPLLLKWLGEDHEGRAHIARKTLENLREHAESFESQLERLCTHGTPLAQRRAGELLFQLDPLNPHIIPAWIHSAGHGSNVDTTASLLIARHAYALGAQLESAIPILKHWQGNTNELNVRLACAIALARIAPNDPSWIPDLESLLKIWEAPSIALAARKIGPAAQPLVSPILENYRKSPPPERLRMASHLSELTMTDSQRALLASDAAGILRTGSSELVGLAAKILVESTTDSAEILLEILQTEQPSSPRYHACLAALGAGRFPHSRPILDTLTRYLRTADSSAERRHALLQTIAAYPLEPNDELETTRALNAMRPTDRWYFGATPTNLNFRLPRLAQPSTSIPLDSPKIPGWRAYQSEITLARSDSMPHGVALHLGASDTPGSVAQTWRTQKGDRYRLSLTIGDVDGSSLDIDVGDLHTRLSFPAQHGWNIFETHPPTIATYDFEFETLSSLTTLRISARTVGGSGPFLGDVKIEKQPPPRR